MRTVPFREVLHGVAYKMGLDPDQSNFLSNQAIPIGTYIDEWVRRTYDVRDWPEWVVTHKFIPDANHIVTWDAVALDPIGVHPTLQIGRVLKVFLIDPRTTDAPIDTPFTLRDEGIHVGYEHGTYVWIRFMSPPPRYTAISWRPDQLFNRDDVTYSYTTGECYKSKTNGNIGHDPVSVFSQPPPQLTVEETQALIPADTGTEAAPQIVDVYVTADFSGHAPIADPMPNGDEFTLVTLDTLGTPLSAHSIVADGVTSIAAMLAQLKVQCDADALAGFTFTVDGTNKKMRIESTTTEFVIQTWQYSPAPLSTWFPLKRIQVQPLMVGTAPVDITPQKLKVLIGDNVFIPGALYTLTFIDNDGTEHPVEYQSSVFDNRNQILNGLALAIGASTDLTVTGVGTSLNTSEASLTLSLLRQIGVDAPVRPPGNPYWELVPFPRALADQVITGAYSDLLKEWGQQDKGMAEQQSVPNETAISETDFTMTPNPALTGQQRPLGRYQLQ